MNPDLWTKAMDKKSCPDLEEPEIMALPFGKSTLARLFLDHVVEETLHGGLSSPDQSSGSIGRRNLAGGVSIAAWTSCTVRK
jgi:hypothetical protein